jgi:hypothetical protein
MTTPLEHFCADRQANLVDSRNINLLTMLSKLMMAIVLGGVFVIVSLVG